MKTKIDKMLQLWEDMVVLERNPIHSPQVDFNNLISSYFATGPFYYYIIDFQDMSISNISKGFKKEHGVSPKKAMSIPEILSMMHPDDFDFVRKAEKKAFEYVYKKIGVDKILSYKTSYNFRFKTAANDYQLYNHQAIILSVDENNNILKSLNIHTNINHITTENNYKLSLIGMFEEPSYLNIDILNDQQSTYNITSSEKIVLKLVSEGYSSRQIAHKLNISEHTVKTHRKNMLKKAGCSSSSLLVKKGITDGWL